MTGNDKDLLYTLNTKYISAISYDIAGNPEYAGEASIGSAQSVAAWRIMKITYDAGNPVSVLWAGGTQKFDKIWDNRTTYVYS